MGSLDEHRKSVGRPTAYKTEYCDEIIRFMGDGYSLTAFAGKIGVARDTIYAWEAEIPEFSDAIKRARANRTFGLERRLLLASEGPVVTSSIFALKNADPDEWREKVTQEHTGGDKPIQVEDVSDKDLAAALMRVVTRAKLGDK